MTEIAETEGTKDLAIAPLVVRQTEETTKGEAWVVQSGETQTDEEGGLMGNNIAEEYKSNFFFQLQGGYHVFHMKILSRT